MKRKINLREKKKKKCSKFEIYNLLVEEFSSSDRHTTRFYVFSCMEFAVHPNSAIDRRAS